MGIKGLLKELPNGKISTKYFSKRTELRGRQQPVDLDTGTLIYVCALRHKVEFKAGNYIPSVKQFFNEILILYFVHKWDLECHFDGVPPPEKLPEHLRRQAGSGGVVISSTYIAMCAMVCQLYGIPFVVAPAEADMQVCRQRKDAVAAGRDSDHIAYGISKVYIIDNWGREEVRLIDMDTPLTDEVKAKYPLYSYVKKYGLCVVHFWAAVNGCDITVAKNGVAGIGREGFFQAMNRFDTVNSGNCLTAEEFAKHLMQVAKPSARAKLNEEKLAADLRYVANFFTKGGRYYDKVGAVHSICGKLLARSSSVTVGHMKGERDPKTKAAFTTVQLAQRKKADPRNLLHDSREDASNTFRALFPPGKERPEDCTVPELKAMIAGRGGTVTALGGAALNKPDLIPLLRKYIFMEQQRRGHHAPVFFDRSQSNGVFTKIDTSGNASIGEMLQLMAAEKNFDTRWLSFITDTVDLYNHGRFNSDFEWIATHSPELKESLIFKTFLQIGNSESQKSLKESLGRVLEMNERLYHAMAWSEDKRFVTIISKQRASMGHEEKKNKKENVGERPEFKEYLVLTRYRVESTTEESHGHTLGEFTAVTDTYCFACCAGNNLCYHQAASMYTQLHHWGDERQTAKPSTIDKCPWVPGSRGERCCTVAGPVTDIIVERLNITMEEHERKNENGRKKNIHFGLSAKFDPHGSNKAKALALQDPNYTSIERKEVSHFFSCLRSAQLKKDSRRTNKK